MLEADPDDPPYPDRRWRPFLTLAGLTLVLALAAIAARVAWFDSYWVFRREPPWLTETGGANRLIDRQTRRAKILQGLTRDYTVALVGSSTTFHGLDPADADRVAPGSVYNLGISGLLADELPIVSAVVASRPAAERVVIGLDYYMFARADRAVRLDAALASPIGRANALLGSLFGRYAIRDSTLSSVEGGRDPGTWTYAGFRPTPGLPPALTRENDAARRRTTVAYRPTTLADLDRALATLAGRRVDVVLMPASTAQHRVFAELGLAGDFARWRADVAALAARRGTGFLDLVDLGAASPFDPETGSTAEWLDNLHFTPVIGRQVLQALGLRRRDGPGS